MNDDYLRIPIVTKRNGNEITKICVDDIYKIENRIIEAWNKFYEGMDSIIESTTVTYGDEGSGKLIMGKGVSRPCKEDVFDEKIGNEIAFRKAKLNANIKKYNFLVKLSKEFHKFHNVLCDEMYTIGDYMKNDVLSLRNYNPEYLNDIFDKNGEIQFDKLGRTL